MTRRCLVTTLFTLLAVALASRPVSAAPNRDARWITPQPPYPENARLDREVGIIYVELTTDNTGLVVNAVASTPSWQRQYVELLKKDSVKWVMTHWHGPPNSTAKVTFDFHLRRR